MTATLAFLAGPSLTIQDLAGSGLGYFGDAGFGASIPVGSWQGRTFVTNGNGTTQGPECSNIKYLNAGSGIVGQAGSGIAVSCIPNYQATGNVRFTYDTAVRTQNAKMYLYDRVSINNPPSGVTVRVAQLIHPDTNQSNNGSGDTIWRSPAGTGVTVPFAPSPGVSGLYAGNGANGAWTDRQHDWYFAMSCSPDSIGAKTQFGAYFAVEYL